MWLECNEWDEANQWLCPAVMSGRLAVINSAHPLSVKRNRRIRKETVMGECGWKFVEIGSESFICSMSLEHLHSSAKMELSSPSIETWSRNEVVRVWLWELKNEWVDELAKNERGRLTSYVPCLSRYLTYICWQIKLELHESTLSQEV
jgi:hypothetical protein